MALFLDISSGLIHSFSNGLVIFDWCTKNNKIPKMLLKCMNKGMEPHDQQIVSENVIQVKFDWSTMG